MEPQFKTSFVPKQPVSGAERQTKAPRRAPVGLLFALALVVMLSAIALSAGLFFYERFVESGIDRKRLMLEEAQGAIESSFIQELTRLDTRLSTAETLLSQHTSLSRLFSFLEENTLASVQFNNFDYEVLPDGGISLTMGGQASNFAAVALQSDVFGKSSVLYSPVFEDLNVDQTGDVTFSVTALVDRGNVLYLPPSELPDELEDGLGDVPFDESAATTTDESVESETAIEPVQP